MNSNSLLNHHHNSIYHHFEPDPSILEHRNLICPGKKAEKLGDAIAISKSETITH